MSFYSPRSPNRAFNRPRNASLLSKNIRIPSSPTRGNEAAVQRVEERTFLASLKLKSWARPPPPGRNLQIDADLLCAVAKQPLPLHRFSPSSLLGPATLSQPTSRSRYGQLEKFGGNDRGDYYGLLRIKMEIDGGKMEGGRIRFRGGGCREAAPQRHFAPGSLVSNLESPLSPLFNAANFTSADYEASTFSPPATSSLSQNLLAFLRPFLPRARRFDIGSTRLPHLLSP